MTGQRVAAPCRLATLGMFIIDQFQFYNPDNGEDEGNHGLGDHVGGGGTYFIIGARVWLPSSDLSMVIDKGIDFPADIEAALAHYSRSANNETTSAPSDSSSSTMMWKYRARIDGHGTTRALNIYKGQQRGFKYLTPRLRLDPIDQLYEFQLSDGTNVLLLPTYIHFICAPERATAICDEVEELLRSGRARNAKRPVLVWEPIPDSTLPENLDECVRVMRRIDVFSPNHDEAASFLGVDVSSVNLPSPSSASSDPKALVRSSISDHIVSRFLDLSSPVSSESTPALPFEQQRYFGPEGPIIQIRSGALGSVVAHRKLGTRWVDAYHTPAEAQAGVIKDVTGAGNACLGGFTAALYRHEAELLFSLGSATAEAEAGLDILARCAAYASVSASFVIEQQGLPALSFGEGGEEVWNGQAAQARLDRLGGSTL